MGGGVWQAMYFNFVLSLVKYAATRLFSVCLDGVVLGGLHVRNGILKVGEYSMAPWIVEVARNIG